MGLDWRMGIQVIRYKIMEIVISSIFVALFCKFVNMHVMDETVQSYYLHVYIYIIYMFNLYAHVKYPMDWPMFIMHVADSYWGVLSA